jgi:hypothetical protein
MPTTRSGGQYGPGVSPGAPKNANTAKKALLSKRKLTKAAAKTYAKAKPQPSKKELATKIKDSGKKKAVQYKKPPVKASVTKAQKISKIQAAKRKEVVDKKRFRGPRIQPDSTDYPDIGTSESIAEDKPGYIFMRQPVDPENDNQPVGLYQIEVIGQGAELPPPSMVEWGAFHLKLMPNTYFSVTSMSEARSAVCRVLRDYSNRSLREGWFKASEEELDEFVGLYSATLA